MWSILKSAVEGYIAHGALSRGAAIAFYVVTSLAPVLLIVVAVAGIVFGQEAVRGGLVQQLSGMVGQQGGELIQTMLASSSDKATGATASVLGAIMVLVTASGVFSEMQTGLNQAWQVKAPDQPVLLMLRARAASLGLVAALGFLLMVSLAASAAISALGIYPGGRTSFAPLLLAGLNTLITLGLFTLLFAAIYKVLPDTHITWREVGIGALITALLFTIGKSLIGWYLGTTAASSGYGAAGALILILLWAYYCAQIFLFGPELTRAIAVRLSRPPLLRDAVAHECCHSTTGETALNSNLSKDDINYISSSETEYAAIREAIRSLDQGAIGRVVLTNREHVVSLNCGKGLMGILLRSSTRSKTPPN